MQKKELPISSYLDLMFGQYAMHIVELWNKHEFHSSLKYFNWNIFVYILVA